jgi:hypothetical protein
VKSLKIYLSASVSGGRDLQPLYEIINNYIISLGHNILTPLVASKNIIEEEKSLSSREIHAYYSDQLVKSESLIAEASVPSLGVGFEIAQALNLEKRVLVIYNEKYSPISAMVSGVDNPLFTIKSYKSVNAAKSIIKHFLDSF